MTVKAIILDVDGTLANGVHNLDLEAYNECIVIESSEIGF
jgi:hydroxymethylpyrimidine pyrophosphatase-like HAD family hydrolase